MKATVLHGVGDLRLEEVPDPGISPDEALIRVQVCGLCGSDIHKWDGRRSVEAFPFIVGHEWCGDVVEVGSDISTLKAGDRVVGECYIPCGTCAACKEGLGAVFCSSDNGYGLTGRGGPGGMAEYVAAREQRLHKVPENLSYVEAALIEPLSVAYHAIWGVGGGVAPHDRVVVFGGGPIGLLAMLTAKAASAQVIVVEPVPYRRELAGKLGADAIVDPKEQDPVEGIMHHTANQGATLILECSGNDKAVAATLHAAATGGRIVIVGMTDGRQVPVQVDQTQSRRIRIIGAVGSPFFFPKTAAFLSRRAVDVTAIVTHHFPLAKVVEAFEIGSRETETVKIMIDCAQSGKGKEV